ncbi:MAG: type II toxin-antitoxin system RelE/ParE family toxin [Bacteroidia bacterium]
MNFKLSIEAANDLEKIWVYTLENWSVEQVERYLNLTFDEIDYLCKAPNSGFEIGKIRKGDRRSKVKSHLIFYKINHKLNQLEVIRVLHEMMEIEHHHKGF